jgi:hypothetical protein
LSYLNFFTFLLGFDQSLLMRFEQRVSGGRGVVVAGQALT